jgi:transposase
MPAAEMNSVLRLKKQKTDRKDAQLLLTLMMEDRFPRIWVPSPENLDVRQLLGHRHRLVQMRTRIMNQLQGSSDERRPALEIKTVERTGASGNWRNSRWLPGPAVSIRLRAECLV